MLVYLSGYRIVWGHIVEKKQSEKSTDAWEVISRLNIWDCLWLWNLAVWNVLTGNDIIGTTYS